MTSIALLNRISSLISDHAPQTRAQASPQPLNAARGQANARPIERARPARMMFPDGVFAALETDPPEKADEAYALFRANALTPGTAERAIRELLTHVPATCAPLECVPSFAWEVGKESTDIGRLRVFSHYLVHMQLLHETNMLELQRLRRLNVKRVRVLRGCCEVCDRAMAGRVWKLNDAPHLPARGCLRHGGCACAFVPVAE